MTSSGFKFDNTYLHLPEMFYTKLLPSPVPKPELVILNTPLAIELDLVFSDTSSDKQAELFAVKDLAMFVAFSCHAFLERIK